MPEDIRSSVLRKNNSGMKLCRIIGSSIRRKSSKEIWRERNERRRKESKYMVRNSGVFSSGFHRVLEIFSPLCIAVPVFPVFLGPLFQERVLVPQE